MTAIIVESADEATDDTATVDIDQRPSKWLRTKHILAFGVVPILAVILAAGSGYLKWQVDSPREAQGARTASVRAATDNTIAILSYQPCLLYTSDAADE